MSWRIHNLRPISSGLTPSTAAYIDPENVPGANVGEGPGPSSSVTRSRGWTSGVHPRWLSPPFHDAGPRRATTFTGRWSQVRGAGTPKRTCCAATRPNIATARVGDVRALIRAIRPVASLAGVAGQGVLTEQHWVSAFTFLRGALADAKDDLNYLDVYDEANPDIIGDGDTGTNWVKCVERCSAATSLREIYEGVNDSRGQSIYMLRQVIVAFRDSHDSHGFADSETFALTLQRSLELAAEAVRQPKQDRTMLGAIGRAADAAKEAADRGDDVLATIDDAWLAAHQLATEAKNSGATAFALLLRSLVHTVSG